MVLELVVSAKPALLAYRVRIVAPGAMLFSNATPRRPQGKSHQRNANYPDRMLGAGFLDSFFRFAPRLEDLFVIEVLSFTGFVLAI
jgi:hypothetical protein